MSGSVMLYFLEEGWQEDGTLAVNHLIVRDVRRFFASSEKPPQARLLPVGQYLRFPGMQWASVDGAGGNPLTYLTAGELTAILLKAHGRRLADWETAVNVFINALPPATPVVLYWTR